MKQTLAVAIAIALGATASSACAVMLNPRGTGQVLIYPYYTVNHKQTLLSVMIPHWARRRTGSSRFLPNSFMSIR